MGLCSCTPTCACAIHARTEAEGGTGLVSIVGDGSTATGGWSVDITETPFQLTNEDGAIRITDGGSYGHAPKVNLRLLDSPTVGLVATQDGLQANLLSAPTGVGGVPTGTVLDFWGDTPPDGFLMCTGPFYAGRVAQADFGGLFSIVEFSAGPDNGDGTFAVPYLGDRVLVGQGSWGGIGTQGGIAAVALAVSELAVHGHGVTDGGHGHPGSTVSIVGDGAHFHVAGSARDSSFVTVVAPVVGGDFRPVDIGGAGARTTWISIPTFAGPAAPQQGNRDGTSTDGLHDHAGSSTAIAGALTGVSINNAGSGAAHENRQPFTVVNKIIKT